jgi:hypothetical protein
MSNDILDTAWQQSFSGQQKKTISRDEAITLLKKHHVYSSDALEDAYQRSCDCWQPTPQEVDQLRKNLEGVPDSEIKTAMNRLMLGNASGVADSESATMNQIHADAEKHRAVLVIDGLSTDDIESRIDFYIAERKRLAFGSDKA